MPSEPWPRPPLFSLSSRGSQQDLTQLEQCVEDDDARLGEPTFGNRLPHPRLHREANAFVNVPLRRLHFHGFGDLGLRRQIRCDILLGPAQQERPDTRGKEDPASSVAFLFYGRAKTARESPALAEEAGIMKSKSDQSSPRWFSSGVPVRPMR